MMACVLGAPFGYREDTRSVHSPIIEMVDKRDLISSLQLTWKRQELERRFGLGSSFRLAWKREEEEELARRFGTSLQLAWKRDANLQDLERRFGATLSLDWKPDEVEVVEEELAKRFGASLELD